MAFRLMQLDVGSFEQTDNKMQERGENAFFDFEFHFRFGCLGGAAVHEAHW